MNLLFEDKDILVAEKPSGLAVESKSISSLDLISQIRNYLSINGQSAPYVGMIHRLDQPVQGILVFAKTKSAAASLSAQVQDGRMEKQYLAVVEGCPEPASGKLEHYLLKDGRTNTSRSVSPGTRNAKSARLTYEVLAEKNNLCLVKIHLITGRHHQIRVQFSASGHPLYGDRKYGASLESPSQGIALCASSLSFLHPATGKRLRFSTTPAHPAFRLFCPEIQKDPELSLSENV